MAHGQAISVVGTPYPEKQAAIEVPLTKKLPEPILPSTQPKYAPWLLLSAPVQLNLKLVLMALPCPESFFHFTGFAGFSG